VGCCLLTAVANCQVRLAKQIVVATMADVLHSYTGAQAISCQLLPSGSGWTCCLRYLDDQ
jgi:hypothetical protein